MRYSGLIIIAHTTRTPVVVPWNNSGEDERILRVVHTRLSYGRAEDLIIHSIMAFANVHVEMKRSLINPCD